MNHSWNSDCLDTLWVTRWTLNQFVVQYRGGNRTDLSNKSLMKSDYWWIWWFNDWSRWEDLNLRPLRPESSSYKSWYLKIIKHINALFYLINAFGALIFHSIPANSTWIHHFSCVLAARNQLVIILYHYHIEGQRPPSRFIAAPVTVSYTHLRAHET